MRKVSIIFLIFVPLWASASETAVCVASIQFQKGDMALGREFKDDSKFEIKIGDKHLEIGNGEGGELHIPDEYERKYFGIKLNGEPYSSIRFNPNKFNNKVCMWLYWPHATWQLTDYKKGKNGCNCFK